MVRCCGKAEDQYDQREDRYRQGKRQVDAREDGLPQGEDGQDQRDADQTGEEEALDDWIVLVEKAREAVSRHEKVVQDDGYV
jgi:hypothetical protein